MSTFNQIVGNPPLLSGNTITLLAFRRWYFQLLRYRLAEVPSLRATNYYISAGGNDSNPGTILLPWLSPSKGWDALANGSGNVGVFFRRGDTFDLTGTSNLSVNGKNNLTIGSYLDPSNTAVPQAAPVMTNFKQYGAVWGSQSGNRWQVAETTRMAAVRLQSNVMFPLIQAASAAECATLAWSWYWSANVLYVNLNGNNPNNAPYKVEACRHFTGDGWYFQSVDSLRIENLDVHGVATSADPSLTTFGIRHNGTGDERVVFSRLRVLYTGYHGVGCVASGGGHPAIAVHDRIAVGYTSPGNAGETALIHYGDFEGGEVLFHRPRILRGTLPSSTWVDTTSASPVNRRGGGVYAHTGGTSYPFRLAVVWEPWADPTSQYGVAQVSNVVCVPVEPVLDPAHPHKSDANPNDYAAQTDVRAFLGSCRGFIVSERLTEFSAIASLSVGVAGVMRINCVNAIRPGSAAALPAGAPNAGPTGGLQLNCTYIFDAINFSGAGGGGVGQGGFSWINTGIGGEQENYPKFLHCEWQFLNINTTDGYTSIIAHYTDHQDIGDAMLFNSIVSMQGAAFGSEVNFTNNAANLGGNLYIGVTQKANASGAGQGYSNDALAVEGDLITEGPFSFGDDTLSTRQLPLASFFGGLTLDCDQNWNPRQAGTPYRGPLATINTAVAGGGAVSAFGIGINF